MYVLQYCSLGETEDSTAWYNKGVALGSLGRNKEAIVCFDEAIKLDPEDSTAWYNKGVALDLLENYDCLLYTSPSPRDRQKSRMPSSA